MNVQKLLYIIILILAILNILIILKLHTCSYFYSVYESMHVQLHLIHPSFTCMYVCTCIHIYSIDA